MKQVSTNALAIALSLFGVVNVCNQQAETVKFHFMRKDVPLWYERSVQPGDCITIDQAGEASWIVLRWNERKLLSNVLIGDQKFVFEE